MSWSTLNVHLIRDLTTCSETSAVNYLSLTASVGEPSILLYSAAVHVYATEVDESFTRKEMSNKRRNPMGIDGAQSLASAISRKKNANIDEISIGRAFGLNNPCCS